MSPSPRRPGISASGDDVEAEFRRITGAVPAERAAFGDAILEGHYVEVKAANSQTLNQVRAVKYITLVAFFVPEARWYVIPASEIVRQCAAKTRGQHTENPFESATLRLSNLGSHVLDDPANLKPAVLDAVAEAQHYPKLKELMATVLASSKALAQDSVGEVQAALNQYGLA